MLVEFNGLPGSGKTTISHCLIGELKKAKVDAIDLQESIRTICKNKFKLALIIIYGLFHRGLNLYFLYRKCLKLKGNNTKADGTIVLNGVKNYCICKYLSKKKKNAVIISDQLFVQSVVSLYFDLAPTDYSCVQEVIDFAQNSFSSCLFVDVVGSPLVSYERIVRRNTRGGRMDKMNGTQLLEALNQQGRLILSIRGNIVRTKVICVDGSDSLDKNCDLLFSFFNENNMDRE